ncbi:MAG: radical SAM protein [Candidatus Thermoplasmatota archaeon]|nr:radical SAM protein [Candidatus Thermoplasmatota archaeon]
MRVAATVLLVNPPQLIENIPDTKGSGILLFSENLRTSVINAGLLSIASYLDSFGISVRILDLSQHNDYDSLGSEIESSLPEIVGVSCPSALSYLEFLRCLSVTKEVSPSIVTVGGGQHVGPLGRKVFDDTSHLDILVRSEGELPMHHIVRCVLQKNGHLCDISGIIAKTSGGGLLETPFPSPVVELGKMPFLKYDLYPRCWTFTPYVEEGRGCRHKCNFCVTPGMMCRYRGKPPSRFLAELDLARGIWGDEPMFAVMTPDYGANPRGALLIADGFEKRKLTWCTEFRADSGLCRKADQLVTKGLRLLTIGLESANPDILLLMGKTHSPSKYLESVRNLLDKKPDDLTVRLSMIFYIGETHRTLSDNLKFLCHYAGLYDALTYTPLVIYPGSELEKDFDRYSRDLGCSRLHTPFWDQRHAHLCTPSRYFTADEMINFSGMVERIFSDRDAWIASRSCYYQRNDDQSRSLLRNIIDPGQTC